MCIGDRVGLEDISGLGGPVSVPSKSTEAGRFPPIPLDEASRWSDDVTSNVSSGPRLTLRSG